MSAAKEFDPDTAVSFIIKHAPLYAKAKAERVYLEEFRKTKKALLMAQSDAKASNAREEFAYAHPDYQTVIDGIREAVEVEETLKWQLTAAQLRAEIWRTRSYTERKQDQAAR